MASRRARRLVNSHDISEEFGVSVQKVQRLHRDREKNGFPASVGSSGRTQEWVHSEVADYFSAVDPPRLQEQARAAGAGRDREELLNASQAAKFCGYKNPNQITTFQRDHPGYFPEPDEVTELGTLERPVRKQKWRVGTLIDWMSDRPGKGRHLGSDRNAPILPFVPRNGDPDELLTAPAAAYLLRFKSVNTFSSSLSQGNLPLLKDSAVMVDSPRGRQTRAWPRKIILEQDSIRNT